jgi:amino acid transporter
VVAAVGIGVIIACFAEVASRFGDAGGPYLYARVAFGRLAGIEMGWIAYLVRLTAAATNANLFVIYLVELWPGAEGPVVSRLILAALIAPLAVVNYRGVSQGTRISTFMVVAKLTPLLLFVVVGLALALPHPVTPVVAPPIGPRAWLDVLLLMMFAFGGFEAALVPLGEARNPRRDAPFALFLVLAVCTALYSLVQIVVLAALADPSASARPLADAARVLAGPSGAMVMAVAALFSVYGYIAGAMVNVPRLTYAMGTTGDLPRAFARVHPRFRTPHLSVVIYATLVWVLAASGSFLQNLSLSAVSRLVTYGLVCAALPVFRARDSRTAPDATPAAAFRLPGGRVWAAVGIGFSLLLSSRMTQHEFAVLLCTVLLGLLNWIWVRRQAA